MGDLLPADYDPTAHAFPKVSWWQRWAGRTVLRAMGWSLHEANLPPEGRAIVIACPHTSNWDFLLAQAAAWALNLRLHWMGKKSLFDPPLGWLLRPLNGIPVDRSAPGGLVSSAARLLRDEPDGMLLMVPASGTRSYQDFWKSGFYHIAREAQVPIILGYLDFSRKHAGLGTPLTPSGDLEADMDVIRAFYADRHGKHSDKKSRIRLRSEGEPTDG